MTPAAARWTCRAGLRTALSAIAILLTGASVVAQNLGAPPPLIADASDIYTVFGFPINDVPGTPVSDAAAALQMGSRARKLGLTTRSAVDAWLKSQTLLASLAPQNPPPPSSALLFSGSTASALNQFLVGKAGAYVRVGSPAITIDQPIDISSNGITLDLGVAQLSASNPMPYLLRVRSVSNVSVLGGDFIQGSSGILVSKSSNVLIDHTVITGLSFDGVVITASSNVTVAHSRFAGLGAAGVIVSGGSSASVIAHNEISGGKGQSNWDAGVAVTDRDVDLSTDPAALFQSNNFYVVYEPIAQRLNPPRGGLIAYNHINLNAAGGIYLDGAVQFTVFANAIQGNAKEGMCLDSGSTANVVASNIVQQNGDRWGQTKTTLQLDFADERLPDGTSAVKLPGISMDNDIYNIVFANNISHNYGGGVKMVRTSFFNVVALNTIEDNNDGVNMYFKFYGVQLGAAPLDPGEIDFAPSRGNVIASNVIRGSHASGIFIQLDSTRNEIIDNVIRDATDWAIESVLTMDNVSIDNLTDMPSQNLESGCCTGARKRTVQPLNRAK